PVLDPGHAQRQTRLDDQVRGARLAGELAAEGDTRLLSPPSERLRGRAGRALRQEQELAVGEGEASGVAVGGQETGWGGSGELGLEGVAGGDGEGRLALAWLLPVDRRHRRPRAEADDGQGLHAQASGVAGGVLEVARPERLVRQATAQAI